MLSIQTGGQELSSLPGPLSFAEKRDPGNEVDVTLENSFFEILKACAYERIIYEKTKGIFP